MVHGSSLKAQCPRLMLQGSWLKADGSWPKSKSKREGLGPGAPRANLFSWTWAMSLEPRARHEP